MEQNSENIEQDRLRLIYGDKVLWVILAILSIISVLLVFSSTAKMAYDVTDSRSSVNFLVMQLGYLIASVVIVVLLHRFSVRVYKKISWIIWGVFVALTIFTLIFGASTNGAARWLNIGFIRIQPSEFLKVATVLHLTAMLTRGKTQIKNLKLFPSMSRTASKAQNRKIFFGNTLTIVLPIYLSVGAILIAHTSSAVLVFIVSLLVLYIAGVNFREIFKLVALAALVGALFTMLGMGRSGTASNRVETWFETWGSDRTEIRVDDISDTERSMIAIQNGGLFGRGAGQSAMRVEMIHPESDYAFAFFVEEYGLILSMLLLLLYIWIFFRAMWIYERCRDPFRELLVLSLATLILVQALLHVMVSVNFLPETGQVLPLVSRGGSALFCTYMVFMLMLSISIKNDEESS